MTKPSTDSVNATVETYATDASPLRPKLAKRIGIVLAALHFLAFIAMVLYIAQSSDGQAPMLWVLFALLDFPASLLYFVPISELLGLAADEINIPLISLFLYTPFWIHGVFATIWWYFLPRLFLHKKYGGVWGKNVFP